MDSPIKYGLPVVYKIGEIKEYRKMVGMQSRLNQEKQATSRGMSPSKEQNDGSYLD